MTAFWETAADYIIYETETSDEAKLIEFMYDVDGLCKIEDEQK